MEKKPLVLQPQNMEVNYNFTTTSAIHNLSTQLKRGR